MALRLTPPTKYVFLVSILLALGAVTLYLLGVLGFFAGGFRGGRASRLLDRSLQLGAARRGRRAERRLGPASRAGRAAPHPERFQHAATLWR
ncbi:MAG: hypothetical protein R3D30_06660 [Hyphomicrobiales bacterium]